MDRVEGDGPAQAPPSIIATSVLQDTLARILGLLEGMAQTRVGGKTSDPMIALDSQTPKNLPAAAIAPRLNSMEFLGIA
ncbi:hypothetical protein R3W88_024566 [Solanum pinnatisectum]|uniref:Uncharacterized protein n=1 Tax=Solanum pinnatisectum TaxID=50273 RepID=A0AAV9M1F7_9SOLN|nr:hypothetical protein R3W88_024566 [Solanum pinnatisectum]